MEDVDETALRELFARATVGQEPPLGSLIEDAQRTAVVMRRRRLVCASGGFAAVAALAAAIGASGALTGPGGAGPGRVQTTAYVAGHAERAIAGVNRVLHAESRVTGGGASAGRTGHAVIWAYHDRARYQQYRPGGGQLETDSGTAVVDGKLTGVVVTYHPDTWYRVPLDTVTGGPSTGCRAGALAAAGHNPPDWPSFIRAALRCGVATVAGRAQVGGMATIKINGEVTIPQGSARLRLRYTLYLNPATYLPVRMVGKPVQRLQDGKASPASFASTEDFQWLTPTAANVAKVSVPIPAGFRETHPWARDQAAGAGPARPPAAPARALLLINGDRVLLARSARGPVPAAVLPAAPGGLAGSVLRLDAAGQVYEIPGAALPYLGRGLSPELFEVSALLRLERAGRLPVRVGYHGRRPTIGSLATITVQALGNAGTGRPAYEYNVVHTTGGGIIPPLRYRVPAASLGTVHARYHQDVPSAGTAVNNLLLHDGFTGALYYPLALPGAQTLYLTGGRALIWDLGYVEAGGPRPLPASGGQYDTDRVVAAGGQLTENWNTYPLHPAPTVRILGPSDPQPAVTSASRTRDTLSINITPFSDNQPGHYGAGLSADNRAKVTGSYQIDQSGTRIAGGKAAVSAEGFPLFLAQARLSAQPSVIRFVLTAARTGAAYRLSVASRTVWTWRSAREPGARLPQDWRCASYWTDGLLGARSCAVQPMMTLRYHVRGLTLNGSAPPGGRCSASPWGTCNWRRRPRSPVPPWRCPSTTARPGTAPP